MTPFPPFQVRLAGCSLPVLDLAQLSPSEAASRFATLRAQPSAVVFRPAAGEPQQEHQLYNEWLPMDSSARHSVRFPVGASQLGVLTRESTLRDFLDGRAEPDAGLLFDSAPAQARSSVTLPAAIEALGLDEAIMSVGGTRRGLPFHNHAAAWQQVLLGRKLYFTLPALGEADRWDGVSNEEFNRLLLKGAWELVGAEGHHALRAALEPAGLHHCVLRPGDVIYLPCNTWHSTLNIGDVIAVGGQQGDDGWASQQCAQDRFGAAATLYHRAALSSREPGRSLPSKPAKLLEDACALNELNFACPARLALTRAASGEIEAAFATIEAAWQRYEALHRSGGMHPGLFSVVLTLWATELNSDPKLMNSRLGMATSKKLLARAVALDPEQHNLKAHTMHGIMQLAASFSKPNQRKRAMTNLKRLHRTLKRASLGPGSKPLYYYQAQSATSKPVPVAELAAQLRVFLARDEL